jgi:uncharacterized protein (TIGR03083 family)
MTATVALLPRAPTVPHGEAMRLAATEYQRVLGLLRSLEPQDWTKATECPGWDVRAMAAHVLGMVEMAASIRENRRQLKAAEQRGGVFIDALTELQVDDRAGMAPGQIIDRFAKRAPKAARGRRLTPRFARRRRMPVTQLVGDDEEVWTLGYLIDVILTRDPWMHRIDLVRATGAALILTPEHDGRIVADIVAEWADRHGKPYQLQLSSPAGGNWSSGHGGPVMHMAAIDFCRAVSGRGHAEGLLAVPVPF